MVIVGKAREMLNGAFGTSLSEMKVQNVVFSNYLRLLCRFGTTDRANPNLMRPPCSSKNVPSKPLRY